jgi:hypothetical protein
MCTANRVPNNTHKHKRQDSDEFPSRFSEYLKRLSLRHHTLARHKENEATECRPRRSVHSKPLSKAAETNAITTTVSCFVATWHSFALCVHRGETTRTSQSHVGDTEQRQHAMRRTHVGSQHLNPFAQKGETAGTEGLANPKGPHYCHPGVSSV